MNEDYQIYQASEDTIPKEDKARLDGYLRGRAEAVQLHLARNGKPKMSSSIKTRKKKKK
jgi:hypothetical protein